MINIFMCVTSSVIIYEIQSRLVGIGSRPMVAPYPTRKA